jgi:hypothetical protein
MIVAWQLLLGWSNEAFLSDIARSNRSYRSLRDKSLPTPVQEIGTCRSREDDEHENEARRLAISQQRLSGRTGAGDDFAFRWRRAHTH